MLANDISGGHLEELIGRSHKYGSERMNGHAPWTMDEAYAIMDILNWPYERMHELFPPRRAASAERPAEHRSACKALKT